MKFPHAPTTVILQPRVGDQFWIGSVEMIKEGGLNAPPWVLIVRALGEERSWPVELFDEITPDEWEGLLWNEEGESNVPFRVRQTLPRDAEVAVSMQGSGLQIPMPIELIDHIHSSSGDFTMPQLFALTDDDGFVATMLLSSPTGLYVRYSQMWHPVTDNTVVENLNVHEVAATALDLFDERERQGQLPAVTSMLTGKNPGEMVEITGAPLEPGETTVETERVVTASGTVLTVPALRRPEDAEQAIAAAADNPDLQWWVERRLKALGLEVDVPWS